MSYSSKSIVFGACYKTTLIVCLIFISLEVNKIQVFIPVHDFCIDNSILIDFHHDYKDGKKHITCVTN